MRTQKRGSESSKKSDSKLKIAMLGHKRVPSREGGIEVAVEELSKRMAAIGHSVTLYNRRGDHVSGKEFSSKEFSGGKRTEYQGIRLKSVFTVQKRGWAAVSSSIAASVCAAFGNYDVVHFHAEGPCVLMWLPKLMGKRCIATVHGLDHRRAKWGRFSSAYILGGEKMAVRWADEIIVLSRDVQEYFLRVYHRKTVLIPNGVNVPIHRPVRLLRDKYGLKKDGYLLFVGRLVPEKGISYLIQAFAGVKTEKKLVIAGGSSDSEHFAEKLKKMAKPDSRILFTGFTQGELLEELYSNAYVFVQPSDLEGMPLTLLEAMSYGNCCLVSDIPECVDVIEEQGVVFKRGNITDLTEKLQNLCHSEQLVKQYKENSSEFIHARHNWDEIVEQTIALYKGEYKG